MAVPLLCGLVPKASFSAVVTSSYSVTQGNRGSRERGKEVRRDPKGRNRGEGGGWKEWIGENQFNQL